MDEVKSLQARGIQFQALANFTQDMKYSHYPVESIATKTKVGGIDRWQWTDKISQSHNLGLDRYQMKLDALIEFYGDSKTKTSPPPQLLLATIAGMLHVMVNEHYHLCYHGNLSDMTSYGLVSSVDLLSAIRPECVRVSLIPPPPLSAISTRCHTDDEARKKCLQDVKDLKGLVFGTILAGYALTPDFTHLKLLMDMCTTWAAYTEIHMMLPIHSCLWSSTSRTNYFLKIHQKLRTISFKAKMSLSYLLRGTPTLRTSWKRKIQSMNHPFQKMLTDKSIKNPYKDTPSDFIRFVRDVPVHIYKRDGSGYKYFNHVTQKDFLKEEFVENEIFKLFPTAIYEIYLIGSFFHV